MNHRFSFVHFLRLIVDVGKNNKLPTLVKANFFSYERDRVNHYPTRRFFNGKLTIDFAYVLHFYTHLTTHLLSDRERNVVADDVVNKIAPKFQDGVKAFSESPIIGGI
ncbi:hypothetical protein MTR_1158s0010 [Medicago truncatula]|uniref:Uncharacterized protein n=1 Tax=Medicago truncatula TaxID=3880 RepID=A0A072TPD2_MEDTR|nr:hypothetical protein MTR_1158s0010 [Medicago truncatula]